MYYVHKILQVFVFAMLVVYSSVAGAQEGFDLTAWQAWKNELRQDVVRKGISPATAQEIIQSLSFDPDVLDKDSNQPSRRFTFPEYKVKAVNQGRIDRGIAFYREHREEIDYYAEKYGVSGPVIVALLGMETDYGGYTGTYDVLNSLATLAYGSVRDTQSAQEGRRNYFRAQIYYAIKMIDEGIVDRDNFKGSWAGAFGINQHMPESFFEHVIDGDNDGDLEIMNKNDLSDVFATTANHLKKVGWRDGYRWGREVAIPDNVPQSLIENRVKQPLSVWSSLGVSLPDGGTLPVVAGMEGNLLVPRGGPEYLVYHNFYVFKRWNNSDYFALAVGSLADQIAGYK